MEITDDHITVALARRMGEGRAAAGRRVGAAEHTVKAWEAAPWWVEVEAQAARLHDRAVLGKARRVVESVLDRALEPECPTSVLNQAAGLAKWYIETRDPDFRAEGASPMAKAMEKVAKAINGLTADELKALADEPVVLGFPNADPGANQEGSTQEARSRESS